MVRNGVVRSCPHQTADDSSSSLSLASEKRRRESVRNSGNGGDDGGDGDQVVSDVRISIQPPTPESSPEPVIRRKSNRLKETGNEATNVSQESQSERSEEERISVPTVLRAGFQAEDVSVGQVSRSQELDEQESIPATLRPGVCTEDLPSHYVAQNRRSRERKPVPAVLRPGYATDHRSLSTEEESEKILRSTIFTHFSNEDHTNPPRSESTELSLRAGEAAQGTRIRYQEAIEESPISEESDTLDELLHDSSTLMLDWRDWSRGWEKSLTGATPGFDSKGGVQKSHCGSETLMQEWRGWSEKWEQSVRMI